MVEERERLLNDIDEYVEQNRQRELNRRRLILCCIFCGIVVFVILAVTLGRTAFRKLHNDDESDSLFDDNIDSDPTKVVFPNNLPDLLAQNEKLCKSVTSNETCSLNDNFNNIYIVKGEHNLTDEQACGVESILRLFPDKTIYLIDFNKNEQTSYSKCTSKPNYLGLLLYLYKDRLQLVMADKKNYFKNTPLQNYTKNENSFMMMAMLLTAYKYGGLVATPDVVMTSRDLVECFPEETIVEPFAILSSQRCDDFLHYLMQTFNLCGHISNSSLEALLTDSAERFSHAQPHSARGPSARRLDPSEISYDSRAPSGSFLKLKRFQQNNESWASDLNRFCKQVTQAYFGIKLNKIEVDEETNRMKSYIMGNNCEISYSTKKNTIYA